MTTPPSPSPASILAVDDAEENLRLLTRILERAGYDVRTFSKGLEAIASAQERIPDLILLDITMPGMDGYAVCERLKSIDGVRDVPVIFLTALSDVSDKMKAFEVGGADYVTKPFRSAEILARAKVHIALRQARVELQHSYERLRSLERLRDDLVNMVIHDMRTPLTVLMAHLGFLELDTPGGPEGEAAQDIRAALHAARLINRMANDLLDVSRLEEGTLPLDRGTHDILQIAAQVQSGLSALDRTRNMDVQEGGPVEAVFDGGIVHRVLENLVNNAIKHTPAGGTIRISAVRSDAVVRVSVQDEGPGVPPDAKERIFEKYGTVDTRKQRAYHSSGLGLAFCKLAIDAHGGAIGVDDAPGGGSIFWFELPTRSATTPG